MLLPRTLLCLAQAWLVLADTQLVLNQLQTFSATTSPLTYSLPASSDPVSVSVALCSYQKSTTPRFFVSNGSVTTPGPDDLGEGDVFEIELDDYSLGSVTVQVASAGVLAVYNAADMSFEVGVSDEGPLHQVLDEVPLFSDSTANQVLMFSPPFSPSNMSSPSYPNYTLPAANQTFPPEPTSPPDYSLFIAATTSSAFMTLPRTGCAFRGSASNVGQFLTSSRSEGLWLRDTDGWRWQWFVNGLVPMTNYTAYAVKNESQVAGPVYFATKSPAFACPIVYGIPFCPSIGYAAPVGNNDPGTGVSAGELPSAFTENLLSGLSNFTTMLTTIACGRDLYSPLVTCADCQAAYRNWLCIVSLPRCAEYASPTSSSTTAASSTSTMLGQGAQEPLITPTPALAMQNASNPRNPSLPPFAENYTAVLPCLEVCHAADRACPPFLGFQCPLPQYTAGQSYGVGFVDTGEEGVVGGGLTGAGTDQWGNVWCNGPGVV
ncbi:stretch-activated Ca2+-permeable channel component-domain-containing protein [Rhodofomes roseus]|uniref:Stretch-activated Ca2+-permeable channel component-domain-containing protein n=1 Tax=Rhodofomes roseus TaxID=34475 RepID=A0ABQ8KQ85_9APHY|nr:stretch-activated Ca2+-permeable channel component-domain-containing protein [Rhodofomes roseus]KAH9840768.1 stretch-activated Ca2+-permeable channel component-domain-containing protein [Rhodofomes roseus]